MIVIVFIVGFIIAGIADLKLRKKYNISKNEKFMDQYINKKHFLFEIFLSMLFVANIAMRGYSGKYLYFMLFLFFAFIFSVRMILEYIFIKQERRFIVSLAYTIVCIACAATILLFL